MVVLFPNRANDALSHRPRARDTVRCRTDCTARSAQPGTFTGGSMTAQEGIEAIKGRIAKAESERDTWRAAGMQEKFLAAYFALEALEIQLDDALRVEAAARSPRFVDTEATWKSP
jgi:hypothetical protein